MGDAAVGGVIILFNYHRGKRERPGNFVGGRRAQNNFPTSTISILGQVQVREEGWINGLLSIISDSRLLIFIIHDPLHFSFPLFRTLSPMQVLLGGKLQRHDSTVISINLLSAKCWAAMLPGKGPRGDCPFLSLNLWASPVAKFHQSPQRQTSII